jgi:hypothetical protein
MAIVKVDKSTYTAETLYQWDKNQQLQIYGLSMSSAPEIHFTNSSMAGALVRSAAIDAAGVVTVDIPNSLLQKPYTITAYVCRRIGATFETMYALQIHVKERTKPADYTLEASDEEVYSFNELEQLINTVMTQSNANLREVNTLLAAYNKRIDDALKQIETGLEVAKVGEGAVDTAAIVNGAVTDAKLAAGSVTAAKLVDGIVNSLKLATAAVITEKLADGAVTTAKLAESAIDELTLGKAKIKTGTYTGTGTSGTASPVSLTFEFVPKLVFIFANEKDTVNSKSTHAAAVFNCLRLTSEYKTYGYHIMSTTSGGWYSGDLFAKLDGTTLTWYTSLSISSGGEDESLNSNDVGGYSYIALG